MKIADAAIGEATKRAKLEIAGLGALGNIAETNILDLGGDAFG